MKYKLIVSDYDGTLANAESKISETTKNTIKKYIDKGGIFTIATGRALQSIKPIAESVGVSTYLISFNGASVYDMKKNEEIINNSFDFDISLAITKKIIEDGNYAQIYFNNSIMTNKRNENTAYYEYISGYDVQEAEEDLCDYMVKNHIITYKVLAFVKENTALTEVERYKEHFGDVSQVSCSSNNLVEFVATSAGKGEMCLKLAEILGIDKSEVMTFGDGLNDLSLISMAGFGVAMENAFDQTKSVAKYVTDTNVNDGVSKAIEKFALND